MRFIDPLITLWHMGGGIPSHLGMAVYSRAVLDQTNTNLNNFNKTCTINYMDTFPAYNNKDVEIMTYVHIISVILILCRNVLLRHIIKDMDYSRQFVKIAHVSIYLCGFLFIQYKHSITQTTNSLNDFMFWCFANEDEQFREHQLNLF